jgi:hypothetical protein
MTDEDNTPEEAQDMRPLNTQAVQAVCREVIQRLNRNPVLAHSTWGSALTAAPSAIAVMAMCLKTAAERQAAGIKVDSRAVVDDMGVQLGELP